MILVTCNAWLFLGEMLILSDNRYFNSKTKCKNWVTSKLIFYMFVVWGWDKEQYSLTCSKDANWANKHRQAGKGRQRNLKKHGKSPATTQHQSDHTFRYFLCDRLFYCNFVWFLFSVKKSDACNQVSRQITQNKSLNL